MTVLMTFHFFYQFYRCVLIAFVVFVVGPVAILADVPGDVETVATALRLKLAMLTMRRTKEED